MITRQEPETPQLRHHWDPLILDTPDPEEFVTENRPLSHPLGRLTWASPRPSQAAAWPEQIESQAARRTGVDGSSAW